MRSTIKLVSAKDAVFILNDGVLSNGSMLGQRWFIQGHLVPDGQIKKNLVTMQGSYKGHTVLTFDSFSFT